MDVSKNIEVMKEGGKKEKWNEGRKKERKTGGRIGEMREVQIYKRISLLELILYSTKESNT